MENKTTDFLNILTLGQVLETIPSGLFLVDCEKRIVYWNKEAERITGYTADEAIGRHCSFLEGIECGISCGLFESDVHKPIIGASCQIRTKSGDLVQLSKNVDYLVHNGRVIGGIESFIDQTQQKNLELQLRQHADELEETVKDRTAELETERSRLDTLLEAMNDPTYITRPDYLVVYANRALRDIFGDVMGRTCFKVFYQHEEPCPNCPMTRTLNQQTVREERYIPANQRTYEILHTPIQDAQGNIQKLSVCRDITERKNAEIALVRANQELDAFVNTVSHDLRTPLTPIIGYAEFLQTEYGEKLEPQIIEMLGEIESQGQKMLNFLEDLLQLARVGQLDPPQEELPIRQTVLDVLEEFQQAIDERQADIRIGQLPRVRFPATLLHQLLSNLVGNALSYGCPAGGRIEIGGNRTDNLLSLFVRDFGPGIPESERDRAFELFFRGSAGTQHKGTGIGLATVKKIARLYNGRAWAEETPGGGCTIRVELIEPQTPPVAN